MKTEKKQITVTVYARQCVMAGRVVPVSAIDRDEDGNPQSADHWDWTGTAEELLENAKDLMHPKVGYPDAFSCRVARALREAVEWEYGELGFADREEEKD